MCITGLDNSHLTLSIAINAMGYWLGRPRREVPVGGSFSARFPTEPDVPDFQASGSLVTYVVAGMAADGCPVWMCSWHGSQTTRDLRRIFAMSFARAADGYGWLGLSLLQRYTTLLPIYEGR